MLSFKSGERLAEVVNAKGKTIKTIYVKEDTGEKSEIPVGNRDELLPKSFYTSIKGTNSMHQLMIRRAIRENKIELLKNNNNLETSFRIGNDLIKDLEKKYFSIPKGQGKMVPVPMYESSRIGVFGPSGVGKSTWISSFFKKYLEYYPKNDIYIFSPKLDDPAYKGIKKLHYVKINEDILEDPLDVMEFKNAICCFDDIESITDRRLNDAVRIFRNACYEIGRSPANITTIAVHHVILANEKTKIILNESDQVVLFPKSNFSQIKSLCARYYGFGRDDLNYVKDVPSRWVCIKRSYPTTIISENAVKVL